MADKGTSDEIVEALNRGTWNTFKDNLEADAKDRGIHTSCPVPAWDELPPDAKEAFDISCRVNELYLVLGAIMRSICEQMREWKASQN